jgi:hypothetical protein
MIPSVPRFKLAAGLVVSLALFLGMTSTPSVGQSAPSAEPNDSTVEHQLYITLLMDEAAPVAQEGAPDAATDDDLLPAPPSDNLTIDFNADDFDNQVFIFSPAIRPERFVDCIDNPYYPMIPGTIYAYEAQTEEGLETVVVTVTNQTKEIMGIDTTVLHDTVWVDGELAEDTYDWFAQDKTGNVWYFGEETYAYDGGVPSPEGSWQAGVDGAVPGIIMLRHPVVGDVYRE